MLPSARIQLGLNVYIGENSNVIFKKKKEILVSVGGNGGVNCSHLRNA